MLSPDTLPRVQRAIADAGLDGWLLYDFRGTNPIAGAMIGLRGMVTRRVFAWVPREGNPVAVMHAIEQQHWDAWPAAWGREVYSAWPVLERTLASLVRGRRIAMEYSPGDAVPYVDRVPAGVLDMVRAAGAEVATSGDLVTALYATWTDAQLASHRRSAEIIARLAREAFDFVETRLQAGAAVHEHEVMQRLRDGFAAAGLESDHGPNVSYGANAGNPHYEPAASRPVRIEPGALLLIDLWAGEAGNPYADQTWMASIGEPSERAVAVWTAVRDARDAAIAYLRERVSAGDAPRGGDVDDAARAVIAARGFGEQFVHRTGHSIDARDLHGSGPHLDNLETRDERRLVPGVGFSVEPGVYVRGEIGVRSEVNAYVGDGELVVTPSGYQHELRIVRS